MTVRYPTTPLAWVYDDTEVDWELMVAYEIDVLVVMMVVGTRVVDNSDEVSEVSDDAVELVTDCSLLDDDETDEEAMKI